MRACAEPVFDRREPNFPPPLPPPRVFSPYLEGGTACRPVKIGMDRSIGQATASEETPIISDHCADDGRTGVRLSAWMLLLGIVSGCCGGASGQDVSRLAASKQIFRPLPHSWRYLRISATGEGVCLIGARPANGLPRRCLRSCRVAARLNPGYFPGHSGADTLVFLFCCRLRGADAPIWGRCEERGV